MKIVYILHAGPSCKGLQRGLIGFGSGMNRGDNIGRYWGLHGISYGRSAPMQHRVCRNKDSYVMFVLMVTAVGTLDIMHWYVFNIYLFIVTFINSFLIRMCLRHYVFFIVIIYSIHTLNIMLV